MKEMQQVQSRRISHVFPKTHPSHSTYFIWLTMLFLFATASVLMDINSVWAQSPLLGREERTPMLARLSRIRSDSRLNGGEAEPPVETQNGAEPPGAELSPASPSSVISVGDTVVTKESIALKIGVRTIAKAPPGTEFLIVETDDDWLGVVYTRDAQQIRGWVQTDDVTVPRVVIRTSETSLASAMDGIDWSSASVTADGSRIAYVVRKDRDSRVVVDGKPGEIFDRIEPGQPVLSLDGERIAYAAKRKQEWFVVTDGEISGPYDSVRLGHPVVSADGSNVICVVHKAARQFLLVNGTEVGGYEEILTGSPIFSPSGKHYAYATRNDGPWTVYLDGEEVASFDQVVIEDMVFAADGAQFACIGKRDGSAVVYRDDRELTSHENARRPLFLPGEGGLCYQAYDAKKWSIVIGSERSERFDDVGDFVADVPKSSVSFWALEGRKWRVVHREEKKSPYDGFGRGSLTLGPRGERLAYVAIRDGKAVVVVDGEESPAYEGVLAGTPIFSPTGQSVAYAALIEGHWRLFVNGVEQRAFESMVEFSVSFTPDGSLPLAIVRRGDRLAFAVGDAVSKHDYLLPRGSRLVPSPGGRFVTVATREDEFLQVETEIQIKAAP